MTVQPRATSVAFADNPVADGVAEVPVIVTVFELYAVVNPVPSNAASLTSSPSTDATSKALLVMITLPSTRRNVLPSVKVDNAATAVMMFTEMLEVEPITSITGNVRVVKLPIVAGAILPPVNTVRARSTPTLIRAGADSVTSAAIVLGKKVPVIFASTGIDSVVSDAIVVGAKPPPTNVSAGADNVGSNTSVVGEKPPNVVAPADSNAGIDRVVNDGILPGTKEAPHDVRAGADRVASDVNPLPDPKEPDTTFNAGIDRVVSNGIEVMVKLSPQKVKTGKLNDVKFGQVVNVNVDIIPVKFAKVSVVDGPLLY